MTHSEEIGMTDMIPDERVARMLRRQDEAREVYEGVRGLALELNGAIERASALGLDVELKVVARRNPEAGTRYGQVIPSLFIGRERS